MATLSAVKEASLHKEQCGKKASRCVWRKAEIHENKIVRDKQERDKMKS
jgi:hypothetical protein